MWIHYYLSAGIHYGSCFWGSSLFISSEKLSANIFLNADYPPFFLFSRSGILVRDFVSSFCPQNFFSLSFYWNMALLRSWLYEGVSVFNLWFQVDWKLCLLFPAFCRYLFKQLLYYHRHIPWEQQQFPLDTISILVLPLGFPLHSYDLKYTFEEIFLAFYSTCLSPF